MEGDLSSGAGLRGIPEKNVQYNIKKNKNVLITQ